MGICEGVTAISGDIGTSSPPIISTRSSSSITPAATIASTSATVKRLRGRPSAAEVTRTTDPKTKHSSFTDGGTALVLER